MGTPGSAPDVSREDVLDVFTKSAQPEMPRTTAEIADEVDCPADVLTGTLEELAGRGDLQSRQVGESLRIWWPDGAVGTAVPETYGRSELQQFGAFVDAVEDYAIFMLDPDGHVVSWNRGARRIKGYADEEILGEHFSTFYTAQDVEAGVPDENLAIAEETGRVEDRGWRVREDGSRFLANVVITAIRDEDGTLQGFTKVTRDLTELQEYEQQLREERDLVEQILETVPVSITVVTPEGQFVRANSRALERLDVDADDLKQYTANSWTLFDEEGEQIPPEETPWAGVAETGEPVFDFRCQVELPDIGRRWLSINAAPLEVEHDEEPRVVLSVDDVSAQIEREQTLRRERDQTEKLLRTAPIPIAVQNAAGETVLANRRAQETLGLSEAELIEDPDDAEEWTLYDAEGNTIEPSSTPTARVRETEEPVFEQEIAIEEPSGERRWFAVNAAPVFGPDGELDRIIAAGDEVTQLKQREQLLKRRKSELETELSEILGRVSDAFYAVDAEWRFTHVNEQAEALLQQSREDLLGERLWDAFPEATDTVVWDRFHEAMDGQEPVSFEFEYDELSMWLEVNAYPSETGLSVYFRDISDRKEREQDLERYRTIVETVNDGIYTVDGEGRFTMVNEAYAEMSGYPPEELIGSRVSLVVDEGTADAASDIEEELVSGDEERAKIEAAVQRADGGTVPAEATFAIFPSDGGYERIGVVRDITERKERERALQESERRYRTLVENFPDGVVALFDEDLTYTAAGGQLLDDLGIDPEEAVGDSIWERYPEDLAAEVEPHFHDALAGEAASFEVEYYGRHLMGHTLPIRDADGEIFAGMLVVQDITERVEYREQLEETIEKLEESNERLEQFAHVASHDLQEPLRMVSSYLRLLEDRYRDELDDDAEEFIDYAVDGAERMRTMVHDLLAYSRLDTDVGPLEPTDPNEVVDDVLEHLQVQIEESDAEIVVDELPTVLGDANQLEQVFQNLVSNAIKYQGDDPPRIEIGADRVEGTYRFRVADNGIGIDSAYTDRIFEIFKRLHTQDDYPGTGIGLALCKKIVQRHGGEIWVDSSPGEGSTFYFTLPEADGEDR